MKTIVLQEPLANVNADVLALFTSEDNDSQEYHLYNRALDGLLDELKKTKEFTGKKLSTTILRTPGEPYKKLLLVGLGKSDEASIETLRRAAGIAAKTAREHGAHLAIPFAHDAKALGELDVAVQAITEGVLLGDYRYTRYKTEKLDELKRLAQLTLVVEDKKQTTPAKQGVERGVIIAESTNYARDLVNTPAADMNPATLEKEAKRLAKKHGLQLTVYDEKELKKRRMQALLAVGQGSNVASRMLTLEYKKGRAMPHVIACGKGVTYDSGGYNLKQRMLEAMKDDMGGAAALLGTLDALARLNAKAHFTVIIGAVENMVSGDAYKPGDVVRASNGKTIEVVNTDAEGRVVLADCLSHASKLKADVLLDVATLTGATMTAIGSLAGTLLTQNDDLAASLLAAGEESGDWLWRLPLWDEYDEDVQSDIADVKNMGFQFYAQTPAGGAFLKQFVKEPASWAHVDMGGAVTEERDRPYKPKGATGWGVRLLTTYLERLSR